MTYLVVAYLCAAVLVAGYAIHLGRRLARVRRHLEESGPPAS